ncbi:uncharacterized protein ACNS7B_016948 isoform 1-T1 [Menidia menidia]
MDNDRVVCSVATARTQNKQDALVKLKVRHAGSGEPAGRQKPPPCLRTSRWGQSAARGHRPKRGERQSFSRRHREAGGHQQRPRQRVLDESGEGGGSGAEHAVAVQRAKEPVQTGGSAASSPAMLGSRRQSSNYQRAQSSMQPNTFSGASLHKRQRTGSEKKRPYFTGTYSSQSGEDLRGLQISRRGPLSKCVSCKNPVSAFAELSKHRCLSPSTWRPFTTSRTGRTTTAPRGYGEEQHDDEPFHLSPPPRGLRQPSQRKLRGLLVDCTEAFKHGKQVHGLPRLSCV